MATKTENIVFTSTYSKKEIDQSVNFITIPLIIFFEICVIILYIFLGWVFFSDKSLHIFYIRITFYIIFFLATLILAPYILYLTMHKTKGKINLIINPGDSTVRLFNEYRILIKNDMITITTWYANRDIEKTKITFLCSNITSIDEFYVNKPNKFRGLFSPSIKTNIISLIPPIYDKKLFILNLKEPINIKFDNYKKLLVDINNIEKFRKNIQKITHKNPNA